MTFNHQKKPDLKKETCSDLKKLDSYLLVVPHACALCSDGVPEVFRVVPSGEPRVNVLVRCVCFSILNIYDEDYLSFTK